MTTHDLFVGRFQPFHLGHAEIVKNMNNPVIVIIKGVGTAASEKNPFSVDQQISMIETVFSSGVHIHTAKNGYVPDIIATLKQEGIIVTRVFAGNQDGDKRLDDYKRQLRQYNEKNVYCALTDIEFIESPRLQSATSVRLALKTSDYDAFRRMMPPQLNTRDVFTSLQHIINIRNVGTSNETP